MELIDNEILCLYPSNCIQWASPKENTEISRIPS